ncbi:archaellar assembly protein FlaJ [Candidatus Woesearchaeota archaeon]|nr:archaellar assembly protein FlaJ [Candidatus Woesearchaeota archaeon]
MVTVINKIGYKGFGDFFLRMVLPVLITTFVFSAGVLLLLELPWYIPAILLGIGVVFVIAYPIVVVERQKVNVQENIHLFITYAGTISTIDLDRSTFFKKVAQKKKYGFISDVAEKAVYLAKEWNLGFAQTLRKLAVYSPSKIFADFLDRFAAIMDFGGELQTFLGDEQDAVMSDYESVYKQSLNNIGMLREVFIAITISVAFGMSISLLLPLLQGVSILIAVKWALVGLIAVDLLLVALIMGFIPSDDLCHKLKHRDEGTKLLWRSFFIVLPLSLILTAGVFLYTKISFLLVVAIGVTPFLITGMFASREENAVFKRDKAFPSFIRALGSTIYSRQGGIISSLQALRVHDFGVLNPMVVNLYRRLKLGSDRDRSWYFFAAESGSNLINYFVHIFAESVYLGGHALKIGEIISNNFTRLINLRTLRQQQASALRGALYGSLVGFIATIYITVSITTILAQMFSSAFVATSGNSNVGNLVSSIIPPIPEVNMTMVSIYIGLLIIIHSFVSSFIIKVVDGGHRMAFFFDFTLMLWIGAVLSIVVPLVSEKLFLPAVGIG